jgi:uncharacterized protein (DUF2141 family)
MRLRSRYFVITAFVLLQGDPLGWVTAESADLTGTLIVGVRGIMSGDGNLRLVLCDSEKNFLKNPVRAEVVEIKDQQGTWTIEELPYGVYAVLVHHDIDTSGTMERHWYGDWMAAGNQQKYEA